MGFVSSPRESRGNLFRNAAAKSLQTLWKHTGDSITFGEVARAGRNKMSLLRVEFKARPSSVVLWATSWLFLAMGCTSFVWMIVSIILLLPVAILFPAVESIPSCTAAILGDTDESLTCVLTASYVFSSVSTCILLLPVWERCSVLIAFDRVNSRVPNTWFS